MLSSYDKYKRKVNQKQLLDDFVETDLACPGLTFNRFRVGAGTVQCYIWCDRPMIMHFFGCTEYCRDQPVLTEYLREAGSAVCNRLNHGLIDLDQAIALLDNV